MFGFVQVGDVTLTGTLANVAQMNVRIEEDEMLTVLQLTGAVVGATAGIVTAQFLVDGVAVNTLPMCCGNVGAAGATLALEPKQTVRLTKGQHAVAVQLANTGGDGSLKGATYDCKFGVTRLSADATMGQGVNSKVQLSM
jgi:hypothetical protein